MPQAIEFWPLQSLYEILGVQQDSISQSGSCLGNVRVHSLILPHTFLHSQEYVMWLSGFVLPWLSSFFLARNLITPCLGHEPKTRVATMKLNLKFYFPKMIILDSHHEKSIQILAWKHLANILVIKRNYIFFNHLANWQKIYLEIRNIQNTLNDTLAPSIFNKRMNFNNINTYNLHALIVGYFYTSDSFYDRL